MDALKSVLDVEKTDEKLAGSWRHIREHNGGILPALVIFLVLAIIVTKLLTHKMEADGATVSATLIALAAWIGLTFNAIGYSTRKKAKIKRLKQEHADEIMRVGRRGVEQISHLKDGYAQELAQVQHAFHLAEQRWITLATKLNLGRAYDAFGGKEPYEVHELAQALKALKARLHIPPAKYPLGSSDNFQ